MNWMKFFLCLLFLSINLVRAQEAGFNFDKDKFSVKFQHIGNLIIIPIELNHQNNLNFVLDTGSRFTIISDFNYTDGISINQGNLINIGGLGHGYEYKAYDTRNNIIKIGKATNTSCNIIVLLDSPLDLSGKMGIPVHGIIGFEALKDYIVEINYRKKKVYFYKHDYFYEKYEKKLRKYASVPLIFHQGKPYLDSQIKIDKEKEIPAKFLIDTGGWDAVWLFEHSHKDIYQPQPNFPDTLGFGLNGAITGIRTKINKVAIRDFEFNRPTTSFPDSASIAQSVSFEGRNGSIGGEILKRFDLIFDYKNENLYVKPNSNFNNPFHYNMSGINLFQPILNVPFYEVANVVEMSPGYEAGIRTGDLIFKINGKSPNGLNLSEVYVLFHEKENKKVTIEYSRKGVLRKTSFVLKDFL